MFCIKNEIFLCQIGIVLFKKLTQKFEDERYTEWSDFQSNTGGSCKPKQK